MLHSLLNHLHNTPFVFFTAALKQIERYENLIFVIMETFSYVKLLSLDFVGSKVSWRILFTQIIGDASYHEMGGWGQKLCALRR